MIVLYKQGIQLTPTLCIAGNGAARLESESACEMLWTVHVYILC